MHLDEKNFVKFEKEVDSYGKRPFLITFFCGIQFILLALTAIMLLNPVFVIKMGGGSINSFIALLIIFVLYLINNGLWHMEKWSIVIFLFSYTLGSVIGYHLGYFNPIIVSLLGIEAVMFLIYFNRAV